MTKGMIRPEERKKQGVLRRSEGMFGLKGGSGMAPLCIGRRRMQSLLLVGDDRLTPPPSPAVEFG